MNITTYYNYIFNVYNKVYMKKLISLLIVIVILIISSIFFFMPSIKFDYDKKLEKGEEYFASEFILKKNGNIINENDKLFTSETGKHAHVYHIEKGPFKKAIVFNYEVIDTIAPEITIIEKVINRSVGDIYSKQDMLRNVEVNEGDDLFEGNLDLSKEGTYQIKVIAVDRFNNTSTDSYEVVVKEDNEAPLLFRSGDGTEILLHSEFNIDSIISYGDNVDPRPSIEVDGYVDTSEIGSYPLSVTVSDFSGNKTSWDLTVEVVEEKKEAEPRDYSYSFEEFKNEYAGEGRMFGLDISEWQGDVDFEAIKKAGCEFIFLRIGWSFEGELTLDKKFRQNIEGAKEVGIPVGIYLFSYDYTEEDLLLSLEKVYKELGDTKLELPLVFDWENFRRYQDYNISFRELNHLYDVFERDVIKHGYQPMLYGSQGYLKRVWSKTDTRDVWLAQYINWPTYDRPYQIWQVCDWGRIDGIKYDADFDILFIDEYEKNR